MIRGFEGIYGKASSMLVISIWRWPIFVIHFAIAFITGAIRPLQILLRWRMRRQAQVTRRTETRSWVQKLDTVLALQPEKKGWSRKVRKKRENRTRGDFDHPVIFIGVGIHILACFKYEDDWGIAYNWGGGEPFSPCLLSVFICNNKLNIVYRNSCRNQAVAWKGEVLKCKSVFTKNATVVTKDEMKIYYKYSSFYFYFLN